MRDEEKTRVQLLEELKALRQKLDALQATEETDLRTIWARLEALIDSVDEIVFEFDAEGTYLNIWTRNEELLSHPREQLLGRRIEEMLGAAFARPFLDAFERVLASGHPESIEYPQDTLGGRRWFSARISPVPFVEGPARTVCLSTRDITHLKEVEERLRAREADLKQQVDRREALLKISRAVQELSQPSDLEGVVKVCFDQLKGLGMDFQGLSIQRLVDAAERRFETYEVRPSGTVHRLVLSASNLYRIWESGQSLYRPDLDVDAGGLSPGGWERISDRFEARIRCILNVRHRLGLLSLLSARPNAFSEAEIAFAEQVGQMLSIGISRVDDLERLEARTQALQASEARLQAVLASVPIVIWALDREGVFVLSEGRGLAALGLDPGEVVGQSVFEVYRDAPEIVEANRRALAGESFTTTVELGELVFESHYAPMRDREGGIVGAIGVAADVTTRRQAERALGLQAARLAEANATLEEKERELLKINRDLEAAIAEHAHSATQLRFQAQLLDSVRESVVATDLEGRVIYWGKGAEALYGYTAEEVMGESITFIVEPQEAEEEEERMRQVRETGTWSGQYVQRRMDGSSFWAETVIALVKDAAGQPVGMIGIDRDITDRKQAEEALQKSEEQWRALAANAPDFICIVERDGGFSYINRTLPEFSVEEVLDSRVQDFATPEQADSLMRHFDRVFEAGETVQFEAHGPGPGGSTAWYEVYMAPMLEDGQILHAVLIARDITERKQMEAELVRTHRLRAVGELSAGVSHNLNNILTGVLGPAELLKLRAGDPASLRDIEDIITSATRARDLVQRLHQAVRGRPEATEAVRVNEVVEEAVRAARPRWKDESEARGVAIEVVTRLSDTPPARGSQAGLYDILLNLLFNAVDAMPEGGTIEIDTETVGRDVRIRVRDTGVGMDEETRRRVFEPFFTTKTDVGTGLGLSTVYGTVSRWGGRIEVESAPGEGSLFSLFLLVWEAPEAGGEDEYRTRNAE